MPYVKFRIGKHIPKGEKFGAKLLWPSSLSSSTQNVKVSALLKGIHYMAVFQNIKHMFVSFKYFKRGAEIIKKARAKCFALQAKIKERNQRVSDIRKQYQITDGDLVELYRQKQQNSGAITYTISNTATSRTGNKIGSEQKSGTEKIIPAGVVSNIDTECAAISNEKDQFEHLSLMIRNLDSKKKHEIDFSELEFLGF